MPRVRLLHDERGVALVIALVVILVLTAIVLSVAQMTTGEIEIQGLTRWDTTAQYLAQAGVDHQIYLLKTNVNAAAIAYTNSPVLPGETAGFGSLWYRTTLTCEVNCTGSPSSRRWSIDAFGEIRRYDGTWTTLQQRTIRVQVDITYTGSEVNTVTLLRWEEVYP